MSGNPMPQREIEEARSPALVTMSDYWRRVTASEAADVRASFHQQRREQWRSGDTAHGFAALQALNDPLGRLGGASMSPVAFVRAGNGRSARGLWRVDNAGQAAGWYVSDFRRRGRDWRIHSMQLFANGAQPPAITQYCNEPGDVDLQATNAAEAETQRKIESVAREAARAEQD